MKNWRKIYLQKILCFCLTMLFSLSFLATSGFSNSECGQMCCCSSKMNMKHPVIKNTVKLNGDCCAQTPAHSCGITGSNTVELPVCTLHVVRAETNGSSGTAVICSTPIYTGNIGILKYGSQFDESTVQSTPIYLQHLSFLI